jgi:hypothetical protein
MGSLGIIFKAQRGMDTLPADWVPVALGPRPLVERIVERLMLVAAASTPLLAIHLAIDDADGQDPRTISVSGVWGKAEMETIEAICDALDARFYDAEMGGFIGD